jgi:hypothetical protein
MARVSSDAVHDVGPRSAHLAGLPYACFADLEDVRTVIGSPVAGDPDDYAMLVDGSGRRVAVTLTCAANAARRVPDRDFARGRAGSAEKAFQAMGSLLHAPAEAVAARMLQTGAEKAVRVVDDLLTTRGMGRVGTEMVAGGGGAAVLAETVGERLGLPVRISDNAPVLSAIGTALALVRDVIERTVPDATEEDVLRIRREAVEAVVRAGADPGGVTVDVEYDARSAVLRAVASGHTELRERELGREAAGDEERSRAGAKALGASPDGVTLVADAGLLRAYRADWERKRLLGLLRQRGHDVALVDEHAVTRLTLPNASVRRFRSTEARHALSEILEECTRYGDAGAELPQLFLGVRGKIVDLSGLASAAQVLSIGEAEVVGLPEDEAVLAVAAARGG